MENPLKYKLTSPILILAALIVIVAGLVAAKTIIVQIILALFISIICSQPILWLKQKGIPHMLSIFMVLIGIILVFFGLGAIVGQSLSKFSENMPMYRENLTEITAMLNGRFEGLGLKLGSGQLAERLDAGKILGYTADFLGSIGGLLSEALLILLITIFMLAEVFSISLKVAALERTNGKSFKYLDEISVSIKRYLSLKTVVSLITGGFIAIWLAIQGVDYAIMWGLVAFMFNFIPNIGSIIAAFPTMVLALLQFGIGGMIWTGTGYFLINMAVGNIIEPRVMGKGLGLSTLVVFLSLIIWGSIFGTVGMLLSVPLTLTLKIVLEKNEDTRWIALLLGTEEDAQKILDS